MDDENIVDEETGPSTKDRYTAPPPTLITLHGGYLTPAWLNFSQLSTQTTPSNWFCVSFLALLLRDLNGNTIGLGMTGWLAPYTFLLQLSTP